MNLNKAAISEKISRTIYEGQPHEVKLIDVGIKAKDELKFLPSIPQIETILEQIFQAIMPTAKELYDRSLQIQPRGQ
jgi:hypothetical protein